MKYNTISENSERQCHDSPGTCRRKLCDCDLEFAKRHFKKHESFNMDYFTLAYRKTGKCAWIPTEHCRQRSRGKLPNQPCHPVRSHNYYAYQYDYNYQGISDIIKFQMFFEMFLKKNFGVFGLKICTSLFARCPHPLLGKRSIFNAVSSDS